MPKVSICIPAYENPDGVKRLLESIFSQLYRDMEVIITDDSAGDGVERAAGEAFAELERLQGSGSLPPGEIPLRYYRNEPPLGAVRNWNRAVSFARGEYIKLMHHDDWFSDERSLGALVDLLDGHPEADLAFCGSFQVEFDGEGRSRRTQRGITPEDEALLWRSWRNLYLGNTIGSPSATLVRRTILPEIVYDPALTWLVDEEYYLQILRKNPCFAASDSPWISIGLSRTQLTERVRDDEALNIREQLYIFRKHRLGSQDILAQEAGATDVVSSEAVSAGTPGIVAPNATDAGTTDAVAQKALDAETPDAVAARACEEYLLARLAGNHLPPGELPEDLGIPDIRRRYLAAVREERRAQRRREQDTARYLVRRVSGAVRRGVSSAGARVQRTLSGAWERISCLSERGRERMRIPAEIAFWAALSLELFLVFWDKSNATVRFPGHFFRLSFALFLVKALHVRRPRREQLAFALGLLLGVISWRCSGRNEILRLVVMLAALRGEPPRRVMKFYFGAMLAGCAALSLLSAAGIFGQIYLVQDFDGSGPDLRWCFGMGNPNAASCMFAMLILTGLWLFGEKLRWYSYLLLLGADLLLYVLCRSALSFGVLLLGLLLSALFRYSARAGKSDLLYRSAGILLAAGLLFCAAGAVWGDSLPFVGWIDTHLLTGRVASLWDTTFRAGTLATWRWFGDRRNTVFFDLGWVRVIYWYGVIPMLAALALVYRWLQVVRERRDTAAFALVCPLVLYTLAEAHLVSVYLGRNIALPLLAACLPYILGAGQGSEQ